MDTELQITQYVRHAVVGVAQVDNVTGFVMAQALVWKGQTAGLVNRVLCLSHLQPWCKERQVFSMVDAVGPCEECQAEQMQAWHEWSSRQTWIGDMIEKGGSIYISGPMSGYVDLNRPAFLRMERLLKRNGVTFESPIHYEQGKPYAWYMEQDIYKVLNCRAIVMLKGWEASQGANVEFQVAQITGRRVYKEI